MELQHQIDVGRLQADDAANVKFDLEILTQEKQWQDQEIETLNTQLGTLTDTLSEQESRSSELIEKQRSELDENHQRAITELTQHLKAEQARLVAEAQREAENRASESHAQSELELSLKDSEIRKLAQANDSLKGEHDRSIEELVQS